jgi:membrane AbrB-like protein
MQLIAPSRDELRQTTETALVGAAGAAIFVLWRIPAGPILGALLFSAAAALAGRRLGWPTPLRNLLFFATGVGAGASVTPAALKAAQAWPLSILVLVAATLLMWLSGAVVFRRLTGADRKTAALAASPGALGALMIVAEEQGADVISVAVAQTLRISTLVAIAPLALSLGRVAPAAPAVEGGPPAWLGWLLLLLAAAAGWRLAVRLKWPAPVFLGALLGSALLHGSGLIGVRLPPIVVQVTAAGLGAVIGSRFTGIRPRDLLRLLPASFVTLLVMALIGVPVGALVGWWVGVGPVAGLMAFAPGSMEMMIAVSLSLNAQPAYVAAHHVVRTLLLLGVLPALAARWGAREARAAA